MKKRRSLRILNADIAPDEIFLDARNMPGFDVQQFEGRIATPISRNTVIFLGVLFAFLGIVFFARAAVLELRDGDEYAAKSEANRLEHQLLFPERGIIYDRRGTELAWNAPSPEELGFSLRQYTKTPGFGNILGYLHYPARDKHGVYYREDYEADVGLEAYYNDILKGKRGLRIIETDALGNVISANTIDPPKRGEDLHLTIDARLQSRLYAIIGSIARREDYLGGAGGIMDVHTGEILALVSYPDFDPNVMTSGDDAEAIARYQSDKGTPFLNRAARGLFTPGSIVKPIFALGGLAEGVITPETQIYAPGYIMVPNPYDPEKETRFNDWRNHGWVDMREAIAQSSDVYFYELAGGYKTQRGLGITKVEQYARLFGYGSSTGIDLFGEADGVIPNPKWKEEHFPDDPTWRLGDTYFTGIGQYGMQVTLLQALKEASILASNGLVVRPHLSRSAATSTYRLDLPKEYFDVVNEGMRQAAVSGTASLLNMRDVAIAAKTGTAELGVTKVRVNSWVIGFFPYQNPRYAFAIVMDRGVKGNTTNATYVARELFRAMASSTPEYLRKEP